MKAETRVLMHNDPELKKTIGELIQRIDELIGMSTVKGIGLDGRMRVIGLTITEMVLLQALQQKQQDEPVRVPCACGEQAVRHQRANRSIQTVCGPMDLNRSVYRCETCGDSFSTLDRELGLVGESSYTAALRELGAFLYAAEPVETAAEHIQKMPGFRLAPSTLHDAMQIEGANADEALAVEADAAGRGATIPRVRPGQTMPTGLRQADVALVEIDGCMLHERPDWKETKLGLVSDLAARVSKPPSAAEIAKATLEGRVPRGRDLLIRKGYVASNGTLEQFRERFWSEGLRWGLPWAERIVTVSDGAVWIGDLMRELYGLPGPGGRSPDLVFVLDWKHAEKHLRDATAVIRDRVFAERFFRRWSSRLWADGNGRGLVRALRRQARNAGNAPDRETLEGEANYFGKRLSMLRYPSFRAAGYPTGSGAIEGSVGYVAQDRCKRRSMSWSSSGLSYTLSLRVHRVNGRWSELYPDANVA